jgi:hypothetical protein
MSAHVYNPSYMASRDGEDRCSRPYLAKKSQNPILTNKKLGVEDCSLGWLRHKCKKQKRLEEWLKSS